jgi:hypothetical protein
MRRFFCALTTAFALLASIDVAISQVVTLHEPVDLRAKPGAKRAVVVTAPAGAELEVLREGREWASVSFDGRRLYAPAAQLANATPSDLPAPDPSCDYGYPYSGSGRFFARPLAQLRHGEPLGFLLGYHRFYPC